MAMTRKEKLPKGVSPMVDRHGRLRYRFRQTGLRGGYFHHHPSTPEGEAELAAFRAGGTPTASLARVGHGTVAWLAARYLGSLAFLGGKGAQRQHEARRILETFVAPFAADRVADFRFDHIEAVLIKAATPGLSDKNRKTGGPHAARNLRRELLPLFNYAIKLGLIQTNPVALADTIRPPRGGFHSWTEDEIDQFRAHHALGSTARLALEIFLWTAQRRGDASRFGPRHLRGNQLHFIGQKTQGEVWLPAAPQLLEAIEAMAVIGTETYLLNAWGKPFSVAGLGNKMREWCDAAGLPHCTAHGLRKATTRRAAEQGATQSGLKGIGAWRSDSQVAVYTAAVEQKTAAAAAMTPVIAFDLSNRKSRN
jgi:integrase